MALFTRGPDKRMTERDFKILELFASRELVSTAIVNVVCEGIGSRCSETLKKLEVMNMIKKYDSSEAAFFGIRTNFYQITDHGYFNYHEDIADEEIKVRFPLNLLHKMQIDYVCAWFIRANYQPQGFSKQETKKLLGKGRIPDLLFYSKRRDFHIAIEVETTMKNMSRYRQIMRQYVSLIEEGRLNYVCYFLPSVRCAKSLEQRLKKEIKEVVLPDMSVHKMNQALWSKILFLDIKTFAVQLFPEVITDNDRKYISEIDALLTEENK